MKALPGRHRLGPRRTPRLSPLRPLFRRQPRSLLLLLRAPGGRTPEPPRLGNRLQQRRRPASCCFPNPPVRCWNRAALHLFLAAPRSPCPRCRFPSVPAFHRGLCPAVRRSLRLLSRAHWAHPHQRLMQRPHEAVGSVSLAVSYLLRPVFHS